MKRKHIPGLMAQLLLFSFEAKPIYRLGWPAYSLQGDRERGGEEEREKKRREMNKTENKTNKRLGAKKITPPKSKISSLSVVIMSSAWPAVHRSKQREKGGLIYRKVHNEYIDIEEKKKRGAEALATLSVPA